MSKLKQYALTAMALATLLFPVKAKAGDVTVESSNRINSEQTSNDLNLYHSNFKGGVGIREKDNKTTKVVGGVARIPQKNLDTQLDLGFNLVDTPTATNTEFQSLLKVGDNFSLGGGFTDLENSKGIQYGNLRWEKMYGNLDLLLNGQVKQQNGNIDPGLAAIISNKVSMAGIGHDSEQIRAVIDYISPQLNNIRPAISVLHVNNRPGEKDGPDFTMLNFTLGYQGKFMSHTARKARVLGTTGMWVPNYITSLSETYNRIMESPRLGKWINLRAINTEFPDGSDFQRVQGTIAPFQGKYTKGFFVGGAHQSNANTGLDIGYQIKIGNLNLYIEHDRSIKTTTCNASMKF